MTFNVFAWTYAAVESSIMGAVEGFGSGLVTFVAAPLALAATVYFILLGYSILRGAIQSPIREIVFQFAKVGFALTAASSIGYTTFVVGIVTNLPGEIIAAGSGSPVKNPGTTFDDYVVDTTKLAGQLELAREAVMQPSSGISIDLALTKLEATIIIYFCVLLLYLVAFASAAAGFFIVIYAKLAVSVCIALAPLALASMLFNSSRWLFDGWLRQTVNFILLMVIMSIITKFVSGMQQTVFTSILSNASSPDTFLASTESGAVAINLVMCMLATLAGIVIYILGTLFFFQAPSLAAGIAGGSSSGGHGFLQAGTNLMVSRMLFRSAARSGGNGGGSGSGGGSVSHRGGGGGNSVSRR